jgi:hypothetical protein
MRMALVILLSLTACGVNPRDAHIAAANTFSAHYAQSRLGKWNVRANAAGADCAILLVKTSIVMDDFMVEALHHGTGAYEVYAGGVQQFAHEQGFRGVAYRDPRNHTWTYGPLFANDPDALNPCY